MRSCLVFLSLHVSLFASFLTPKSHNDYLFTLFLLMIIGSVVYLYFSTARHNRKLAEALNRFETLVESTIEGIIIFDEEQHCIMANQAAVEIFGYSKSEFKGKHLHELIAKAHWNEVDMGLQHSHVPPHEILSLKKDGSSFVAWTRGVDTLWNNQKVRISSVIDITEYKNLQSHLEKRVAQQVQEIEQKNQMIGQQHKLVAMGEMIGAIAHQWRQPLNALSINIQNLEDDYQDGLLNESFIASFVVQNQKIITYMSKTIDDFRNFFRIDKQTQTFSVLATIEETLQLQNAQLRNYLIDVSLLGEDFTLHTFKSEFQQVLLNLLSNAKDAILRDVKVHGHISITLTPSCISIEDNGGGIEESVLERIFEPYFTTKEQGKGIGLGLYISKMIVEQHLGGTLCAENGEYGAKFSIKLLP